MLIKDYLYLETKFRPEKTFAEDDIKYVVAYPDLYNYGLPNLGMQVIYRECNKREGVIADRYYLPENTFSEKNKSWEHGFYIKNVDFLSFTISYEGLYTNILKMLKSCEIPIWAVNRKEGCPLVIGGGPNVMYNPLPLSGFFDVFIMGEGEQIIHDVLDVYKKYQHDGRDIVLQELSRLNGVYVPKLHKSTAVFQVFPVNIRNNPAHSEIITDQCVYGEKAFSIEVRRGCNQKCRFCYMGTRLRPARTIAFETFANIVDQALEKCDIIKCFYEGLETDVVEKYLNYIYSRGGKIRVGSQRLEKLSPRIIELMSKSGQRKLVIAPESSERLRKVIGKEAITDEKIKESIDIALANNMPDIGLYFIIGLPNESMEDIDEIIRIIKMAREKMDAYGNTEGQLEIGLNPLFPKPWTALQFAPICPEKEVQERFLRIYTELSKNYPVFVSNEVVNEKVERRTVKNSIKSSIKIETTVGSTMQFVQPILSLGGVELCPVIEEMCELEDTTCNWKAVLEKYGVEYMKYFTGFSIEDDLPWEFQNCIVSKEYLVREYQSSMKFETTTKCDAVCGQCEQPCIEMHKTV